MRRLNFNYLVFINNWLIIAVYVNNLLIKDKDINLINLFKKLELISSKWVILNLFNII